MAYDEGLAELLRGDLIDHADLSERKMFGGLCFMLNGNMLCGVHKGGGMFRVGKDNESTALGLPGVTPMQFTGRKMGGMVEITDDALVDDTTRAKCLELALDFVAPLPAK